MNLTPSEISNLLKNRKYITIGRLEDERIAYRMFWSEPDQDCYVAIQGEANGQIITIQPLSYLRRELPPTEEMIEELMKILRSGKEPAIEYFEFSLRFKKEDGRRRKVDIQVPAFEYQLFAGRAHALQYSDSFARILWFEVDVHQGRDEKLDGVFTQGRYFRILNIR